MGKPIGKIQLALELHLSWAQKEARTLLVR